MQRDKMGCEVKQFETVEEKKKEKSYSSPKLEKLGKMQRLTLGKTTSGIDNFNPGDFVA